MFIKQLSVFIENREGRLQDVLNILSGAGLNIVGLSLADTSDYGILRLILSDPEVGKKALSDNGFSARITNVLGIKVDHHVGGLSAVLNRFLDEKINIEYMYSLQISGDEASAVIKTSDIDQVQNAMEKGGISFISQEDISKLSI